MWCIALVLMGVFYARRISKECFRYCEIRHSVKILSEFCIAYPSNCYEKQLNALLKNASVIGEYVPEPRLSRTLLPNANYHNASRVMLKMMDNQDAQRHNILRSLNPMNAVKDLVFLPVTVLRWIGFKPGKIVSTIIASIWWVLQYLLDMFQPEIRALLIELIGKMITD